MSAPAPSSRVTAAAFWPWLAALAVVSLLSLATYAAVQQALRSGANDPQVQLVEDAAARLASGARPGEVLPAGHVDAARSLAPWVAIALVGSGVIDASADLAGRPPLPPPGVLAAALHDGEHRVTWRPSHGVRIALVVTAVSGRPGLVVLAGRSLRETEERIDRIGRIVGIAWGAAVFVLACAGGLVAWSGAGARRA